MQTRTTNDERMKFIHHRDHRETLLSMRGSCGVDYKSTPSYLFDIKKIVFFECDFVERFELIATTAKNAKTACNIRVVASVNRSYQHCSKY